MIGSLGLVGIIVNDGPPLLQLTSNKLTNLFDYPVQVIEANGFYQVVPMNN